jgi:predicted DNA-binding WGR domain protein
MFKWLKTPTGDRIQVKAYKTWSVRWMSRYGRFSSDTQPEMELFTSEEDAVEFKNRLMEARSLLKYTADGSVELKGNQ